MLVVALISRRRRETVHAYARTIAKPIVVIAIGYCVLSNVSFQFFADGSLSMRQAEEAGLVTMQYAERHASEVVLFKRVGPKLFEYRVSRPLLGYAGIPWLIAHRTTVDLVRRCESSKGEGCMLLEN